MMWHSFAWINRLVCLLALCIVALPITASSSPPLMMIYEFEGGFALQACEPGRYQLRRKIGTHNWDAFCSDRPDLAYECIGQYQPDVQWIECSTPITERVRPWFSDGFEDDLVIIISVFD